MGPVEYGENQEEVFLGRSVTQTQSVSEEVAQKIDKEIRKLVDEGYNQAKKILTEKIDDLHKIAKALMTYETLTGEEIENIINKNEYPKDKNLEKPEDKNDESSALGAMGLKPKIVH
jgi:cell division protease FtsH